jgi:Cu+-exporting ATPase
MITGDNQRTAEAIAKQVGIDRVLAEVLPGDKAAEVKKLQSAGQLVAMVGDGVNDAPALAQADIGIALGTGTDVAMAAAGITLISGDLRAVGRAISLSRGTLQTIVQNLFWAFFYNVVLIPIAAFGFLVPMIAAGAMAFSSIFVVTNSLRLRGYKVQTLAAAKSLPRQLVELTPRLIAPAAALAVLIAISTGWLMPAQEGGGMMGGSSDDSGPTRKTTTYRAFIETGGMIVPRQAWPLSIVILDQFGKPFTDFDYRGSSLVSITAVRRDLAHLAEASLMPITDSAFQANMTFPEDGQYVVFVDFKPVVGTDERIIVPLAVGAADTPAAVLTPRSVFVQAGGGRVSLQSAGPLKANQRVDFKLAAVDAEGLPLSEMDTIPLSQGQVVIVDEALTTLLRPVFSNRQSLQFSATFPRPGKYQVWLSFWNPDRRDQVAFVVDVQ